MYSLRPQPRYPLNMRLGKPQRQSGCSEERNIFCSNRESSLEPFRS